MFDELSTASALTNPTPNFGARSSSHTGRTSPAELIWPRLRSAVREGRSVHRDHRPGRPDGDSQPIVEAAGDGRARITFTIGIEMLLGGRYPYRGERRCASRNSRSRAGCTHSGGATFRLVREAGWGNAMRYLLTADGFGAAEALQMGLVQEVTEPGGDWSEPCRSPNACDAVLRSPCKRPSVRRDWRSRRVRQQRRRGSPRHAGDSRER